MRYRSNISIWLRCDFNRNRSISLINFIPLYFNVFCFTLLTHYALSASLHSTLIGPLPELITLSVMINNSVSLPTSFSFCFRFISTHFFSTNIMLLDFINRPVFIPKENIVTETGSCLRFQVEPTRLGTIDRASTYLSIARIWRLALSIGPEIETSSID
jgi:hypothetical protein